MSQLEMIHAIEQLGESESSNNDSTDRHLQAIQDHVDTSVRPNEKAQLAKLVHRYSDVIREASSNLDTPTSCNTASSPATTDRVGSRTEHSLSLREESSTNN